jgi:hypothetical protein
MIPPTICHSVPTCFGNVGTRESMRAKSATPVHRDNHSHFFAGFAS